MQIFPVPAFTDNYFWLIQPDAGVSSAYIVDPGSAPPAMEALSYYGLTLAGILITHHHHDHIGGVTELANHFGVPVYGPKSVKIPQVTDIVADGDKLKLGSFIASVSTIPGHTLDHIAYYFESHEIEKNHVEPGHSNPEHADTEGLNTHRTPPRLFSGDTIFAAGCGRLFDGTALQLCHSLVRIAALPPETLIYAAHEYTLANIRFALHIEPDNPDLIERQVLEIQKRQQNLPTLPTTLAAELQTNPFMRCHLPQVQRRVEELAGHKIDTFGDTFTQLRLIKDQF